MTFVTQTQTPAISVLLPVRDRESYITSAVASILDQDWSDFELIIIDHLSTDGTSEILKKFQADEKRIKLFRFEGSSFIDALNFGLSKCQAKFIARIDSDDIAHPQRLGKQIQFLKDNKDIAVIGSAVTIIGNDVQGGYKRYEQWVNSLITPEDIAREIFTESPIPNPTAMMRRDVVEKLEGYKDFGWPEDYDFWLRCYLQGVKMAKLPEPLLQWRDHDNRITRIDDRYSKLAFLEVRAFYMAKLLKGKRVVIQGAGITGKNYGKFLKKYGLEVIAFIDIDKKKVGGTKVGVPVYPLGTLPEFKDEVIVSAVSQWGARELVREAAIKAGFVEGKNFFCVS